MRNLRTVKVVYYVNVSESCGASSPGWSRDERPLNGCCCCESPCAVSSLGMLTTFVNDITSAILSNFFV